MSNILGKLTLFIEIKVDWLDVVQQQQQQQKREKILIIKDRFGVYLFAVG